MNELSPEPDAGKLDFARFTRAVRFAFACVILGFSYLSIRSSLGISAFARIFEDMLGDGARLPWLTVFVMDMRLVFLAVSVGIPIACVALIFSRNAVRALYLMGVLTLVSIVQCIVFWHALTVPFIEIIRRMQEGPE